MATRVYRMTADEAQVDAAGTPPRPASVRAAQQVFWDIPDTELADIPPLRRWFREHGIDASEHGEERQAESPPGGAEPYLLVTGSWTSWKGAALTRLDPCEGCGLNISTVVPPHDVADDLLDNVLGKLDEVPLSFLSPAGCYAARPTFVDRVRAAGLDQGLVTHPLGSGDHAVLIWSDHGIGGPAYRYGPTPCSVCGRAIREVHGMEVLAHPNYAFGLTFSSPLAHWSWSTVYGQQTPLISHVVAEFLLTLIPTAAFIPHGSPDTPGAFLPEQYQG